MGKIKLILDVIEDVRGTVGFFMFILEEAIQTASMACWLLWRAGLKSEAKSLASWAKAELVEPAQGFCSDYGSLAYPMNECFSRFYEASRRAFEVYEKLE